MLLFPLVCGIVCHGLVGLPLGIISRLWPVNVAIPGHILYYCCSLILLELH